MTEHSPLPWEPSELASGIIDDTGKGIVICNTANAAFIVKAVNNHEGALEIIESLLGLELGSGERALAFLGRVKSMVEPNG